MQAVLHSVGRISCCAAQVKQPTGTGIAGVGLSGSALGALADSPLPGHFIDL